MKVAMDVIGDGNCFYRALYGAASVGGLLQKVAGCAQGTEDKSCWDNISGLSVRENVMIDGRAFVNDRLKINPQEDEFVRCLRTFLASKVEKGYTPSITSFIEGFRFLIADGTSEADLSFFYEQWLFDAAKKAMQMTQDGKDGEKHFNGVVAARIRKDGQWVCQLEVSAIIYHLSKCGVKLRIASNTQDEDQNARIGENEIVLINANNHYQYMMFIPPNASRNSRTGASRNSRTGASRSITGASNSTRKYTGRRI
jgi:hypothetical protein